MNLFRVCAASLVLMLSACPAYQRDSGIDSSNEGTDNVSSGTLGGNPQTRVLVQLPDQFAQKKLGLMLCAREAVLDTASPFSATAPFMTDLFEDKASHLIDFENARAGLLEIASKRLESGVYRTMTFLLSQTCDKPYAVELTNEFGTFRLLSSQVTTLSLFELYGVVPNPENQIYFAADAFFNALETVSSQSQLLELFLLNRRQLERTNPNFTLPPTTPAGDGKGPGGK